MKILLKNGYIIDGSENAKRFKSDILIEDDKIAKIENDLSNEKCDEIIDCEGLIVAPGFIDAHSHNDFFYDRDDSLPFYHPFIEQGITTQITGNCGFSPFGIDNASEFKNLVGGGLFHTAEPGSFKEFVRKAENNIYVNMVPLIGHGTTRISVSGYDPKPLSAKQIDKIRLLVNEAMANGAFGGSYGFMYEPGIYSSKDELYAFAEEIAKYDGIVTVHPRANSKVALGYPLISRPHIEIALDEVVDIMKKTKVRMEYSHLIFVGTTSWDSVKPMLKKFHKLNEQGYEIAYDNYAFNYGASVITVIMPPWYMALSKEERKKASNMRKLRLMTNISRKLVGIDFCDFTVAYISDDHKEYEGKTVAQIAQEEGVSNFDMYIKLVDISKGQGRLYLDKYYNDEIVRQLMEDDLSIFMTDAWVEEAGTQNGAAYQCFPYFIVRSKNYGIPIENVIHKMTGKTAARFRIPQRGLLKEGNFADITVFDYDNIKVNIDVPSSRPEGIKYVFINGNKILADKSFVNKKAGKVVLKK